MSRSELDPRDRFSASALTVIVVLALAMAAGCGGKSELMPTPNLYVLDESNPFADVPAALQSSRVQVLYVTDRIAEGKSTDDPQYGYKRSRSIAYGISELEFGENISWDSLVKASRSARREIDLPITILKTTELGRLPPTPSVIVEMPETQSTTAKAALQAEISAIFTEFRRHLSERLALTPRKEVNIFVHGYNNNFADSVITSGELWHFLGREGVPLAYSWPAGRAGLLRGYTYDRESSEFTVYHLKEMIRLIAEDPEVEKINILAHSRGTDVAMSALRELHLEISGSGRSTREVLKLGTFVLAAPDLDIDVVIQRFVTARLGRVPERFALYVCDQDEALSIANWLFGGLNRLGRLRPDMFSPEELKIVRASKSVQIIDAQISNAGAFGHDYFHSNPAVSSDLILLMRYHRLPGAEHGRPLRANDKGFWAIDDDYPAPAKNHAEEDAKHAASN